MDTVIGIGVIMAAVLFVMMVSKLSEQVGYLKGYKDGHSQGRMER